MIVRHVSLLLLALTLTGCDVGTSYTPERAATEIVELSRERFKLTVTTRLVGQTLYASTQLPGFLRRLIESGNLAMEDSGDIGDLLLTTTQVSLSTHPPIRFYILRLADPEARGAELRYVTYLDDVRRLYASALGEMEFFDRRVQELKLSGAEAAMTDAWMVREPALGEFLAVQLALRIKALGLQDAGLAYWHLEDCVGWFQDRNILLTVARNVPVETAEPTPWPPPVLTLIAQVLAEYRFDAYDRLLLTDTATGLTHQLTPDELKIYWRTR